MKQDRRDLIFRWGPAVAATALLGGAGTLLGGRPGRHVPPEDRGLPRPRDWRSDAKAKGWLALASGRGAVENLRGALALVGGIEAFVRPGEKVVIKPNCAWDRTPEQAANTDPGLVAELVRLCLAAGAATVVVADSTCHEPDRTFERSGIGPAASKAGAAIAHQNSGGTVDLDLGGTQLGVWPVLRAIAEADRVINVPVVKHHSLARATVGMKNWMGAVGGQRSRMHQHLPQVTAELAAAFRPTLTVIDATRILVGGGPTGGSLSLVRAVDRLAVATDPVAADAWGASLLDLGPDELPHLRVAERLGLGTADWKPVVRGA